MVQPVLARPPQLQGVLPLVVPKWEVQLASFLLPPSGLLRKLALPPSAQPWQKKRSREALEKTKHFFKLAGAAAKPVAPLQAPVPRAAAASDEDEPASGRNKSFGLRVVEPFRAKCFRSCESGGVARICADAGLGSIWPKDSVTNGADSEHESWRLRTTAAWRLWGGFGALHWSVGKGPSHRLRTCLRAQARAGHLTCESGAVTCGQAALGCCQLLDHVCEPRPRNGSYTTAPNT